MELGDRKRKHCDVPEEEGDPSQLFIKYSDEELKVRKERAEKILSQLVLNDNGVKMRVQLSRLIFEMRRRGLLPPKDGDTCTEVIPVASGSTCAAATDGSAGGATLAVPGSNAIRSFNAGVDMDDQTGHEGTGALRENKASLKSCNHKNAIINGDPPSHLTDDIDLSSGKTSVETGTHLPVNTNEASQSNCEDVEDFSYTSLSHSCRDPGAVLIMKAKAPHLRPLRSSRRNNQKSVVLVDEEEQEDHLEYQGEELDRSVKENTIYYPSSDDPKAIEIRQSDMQCLDPEAYVSSSIMIFYMKYLQKTSSASTEGCNYQIFNTYFYKKLQLDVLNKIDKETSFEKFRRWWKGINLFEKAYIFIPIHESLHWSLVIICIPAKEDESGIIVLHLDSLGLHTSRSIFKDVKSFLIEEWNYLRKENVEPPVADKLWDKLSRRIEYKKTEVPQQNNEYDCGLFVLFFIERFLGEAPERLKIKDLKMFGSQWFRPEEASDLRLKIKGLLTEEFAKASKEGTSKSDS